MNDSQPIHAVLPGRLLVIGTGCVAQALLPLLWRHVAVPRERVALLGPDPRGASLAHRHGVAFHRCRLTPANYTAELSRHLQEGDLLVNLALGVGSLDVLGWCQAHGVIYVDSNLEPWAGQSHSLAVARAHALADRAKGQATAVIAHGANPGLVSHFLKEALERLAPQAANVPDAGRRLGLQVVQISERDDHRSIAPVALASGGGRFANTWSARGLAGELCAAAELAWGRHEPPPPAGAAAPSPHRPWALRWPTSGRVTRVRTWTPSGGECAGYLLAHHEAFSLAELLAPQDHPDDARPTVFYGVRPCPAALAGIDALPSIGPPPPDWHYSVLTNELSEGGIELGVLLLGDRVGHWYGSRLSLAEARRCAPDNNATSLQVAAGVLGALVWALENPRAGVVEAEDLDHHRVMTIARPYLGDLIGIDTPWRPPGA
ncbi:MAG: saccharopine dehydrogenase NADP-binding domain-containing protein, partial [Zoogloeaceae bacterium]|nr:saccharopine dehydrogenase NADP-binding domain-containing protein [Zoogloeaceae bacterium]